MSRSWILAVITVVFSALVVGGLYLSRDRWISMVIPGENIEPHEDIAHAHDEHDHAHDDQSVVLSAEAFASLGFELATVVRTDFEQTIQMPAMVVENPGLSTYAVSAKANAVIDKIWVTPGESLRPGTPLVTIRFTGDALANAQAELLRTLARQASIDRELERIEPLVQSGSIPEKNRIALTNERLELEASRQTTVQQLSLLGLSDQQIETILDTRSFVRESVIVTPPLPSTDEQPPESGSTEADFTVESMNVHPGQRITAGETLCTLAYHRQLMIEGYAFFKDLPAITVAMQKNWLATTQFGEQLGDDSTVRDLRILYVNNHVDPKDNTFRVYALLPNSVLRDVDDQKGRVFRSWKYRPGQKAHLIVPTERRENQLTVPAQAVLTDGLETCVFREVLTHRPTKVGDRKFARTPVQVIDRNRDVVVVSDDSLFENDRVMTRRVYLLLNELKSEAGGGQGHDHHGHSH